MVFIMNPEPTEFFYHPHNRDILVSPSGAIAFVLPKITVGDYGNEVKIPGQGKVLVRRLVAETFVDKPTEKNLDIKLYARVIASPHDDSAENVTWGGRSSGSKLTDDMILAIKSALDGGMSAGDSSKKFMVSKTLCLQLKAGTYPRLAKITAIQAPPTSESAPPGEPKP
jgi:hypothetical protein